MDRALARHFPPYSFALLTRHGRWPLVCFAASLTAVVCVILGALRCVRRGRPQGARAKMGQRASSAEDLDQTPEVLSCGRCLHLLWQSTLAEYCAFTAICKCTNPFTVKIIPFLDFFLCVQFRHFINFLIKCFNVACVSNFMQLWSEVYLHL